MKLAKNIKKDFKTKTFLYNVIFYQVLILSKFLKISCVLLEIYGKSKENHIAFAFE